MANVKINKYLTNFGVSVLQIEFFCLPSKSRSKSQSAIFAITPFDGKCQNLQMSFFYIFDCNRQMHTERDKQLAIGRILQMSKNDTYRF